MIKIIDGFRYDTDKAIEIGWSRSPEPQNIEQDLHQWKETLYKTVRAGRFFIHGEGGPLSRWASIDGMDRNFGAGILPISAGQARAWCEQYLSEHKAAWAEHFPPGTIRDV